MLLAILIIVSVNLLFTFNMIGHISRFTSFLGGKLGGVFMPTFSTTKKEEKKP